MKKSIDISEELKLISPVVAEINAENPFEVPKGYFEVFPEKMIGLVGELSAVDYQENEEPRLSIIPESARRGMPFNLPEEFFDQFAGKMMKIVSNENEVDVELKSISPVVAEISRTNPFQLPHGYFEQLTIPVFETGQETGKVIRMNTWRRIAVAAVFTGLILLSTFFLLNSPSDPSGENSMSGISDKAIENFLNTDDIDLPATTPVNEDLLFALINIDETTISEMLETVEDDAISDFMKDNSVESANGSFN